MSTKSKRKFGSNIINERINENEVFENGNNFDDDDDDEDEEDLNNGGGDEDSMIELGQIALLSSSRASLRYRSNNDLAMRAGSTRDVMSSRLLLQKRLDGSGLLAASQSTIGEKPPHLSAQDLAFAGDGGAMDVMDDLNLYDKVCLKLLPFKGYIFGILSAFSFSAAQVTMKRAKWLSGSDHSLVRYIVTLIVMFTVLKYKNLKMFGPKKLRKILFFRGFVGSCALITLYFAIMLINPSDAITIAHTSILLTAVLARIFLNEKITLAHFIALALTVVGVLFICKPSFLFGKKVETELTTTRQQHYANLSVNCNFHLATKASATLVTNGSTIINGSMNASTLLLESNPDCIHIMNLNQNGDETSTGRDLKVIIGIFLTFVGAFASSCVYLVLKKLSNSKVHWASNTIFVCWFGIPFSIVISIVLIKLELVHKDFASEKKDLPMDLFYSGVASCLSITGQIFLNNSLKYEDATKIAIVKTIDVFFSYMLQYILLSIAIDLFSLIGAVSIISGTFFVLLFKLLENKYERYKKREHKKLLKQASCETGTEANKEANANVNNSSKTIGNGKNVVNGRDEIFGLDTIKCCWSRAII